MSAETLSGQVRRIIFQRDSFQVFELLLSKGRRITVSGVGPHLSQGDMVEVTGQGHNHPRYGNQIQADSIRLIPAKTSSEVLAYLSSGKIPGIGPALAQRIVDHFQEDVARILDETPQRLREVSGVGQGRLKIIVDRWQKDRLQRDRFLLLASLGLSSRQIARIDAQLGDRAISVIRENPYHLIGLVDRIGFRTADRFAASVGVEPTSVLRARAAILHIMQEASQQGHVYLDRDVLLEYANQLLQTPDTPLSEALDDLLGSGRLVAENGPGGLVIYERHLYAAEVEVASRLRMLSQHDGEPFTLDLLGADFLAPSQQRALQTVASHAVSVLTGGPGTGKTTIVAVLLQAAIRAELRVALAAPTGRAAMRMKETTGHEAKTLHRLLEFNPKTGEFLRNAYAPLEVDWVIVDEASMIDIRLMRRLLSALPPGVRLTLVGDANQLPPVGPGSPFWDVISSGEFAVARLVEVFRQDQESSIVTNAHRILLGDMPQSEDFQTGSVGDFYVVHREDAEALANVVEQLVCERIPARLGLDPRKDIMVLSPMHKTACGVEALNQRLRQRLNPTAGNTDFYPSDRVMVCRNNYRKEVFNGDIGTVLTAGNDGNLSVDFDGRIVSFEPEDLPDLTLAYAITIHKSQGSEFSAVVICLHPQHYMMLRRNLVYTGLTRGKRLCVICTHPRALRMAVQNDLAESRNSMLAKRLKG